MIEITDVGEGRKKITVSKGEYSVSILTQGAILNKFTLDGKDAVLGYEDWRAYVGCSTYMGALVGPIANRVKDASFIVDGVTYNLEKNNGNNCLHSGSRNYGNENFEMVGCSDSSVTLALISKESAGIPGNHEVMVTYLLQEDGTLTLNYSVRSDRKCPVNITNHAYFNLNGCGDIRKHRIRIDAPEYVEVDENLIPVKLEKTEGSDFDFTDFHEIGERRDGAYDNCFALSLDGCAVAEAGDRRLTMRTTMPGVQLYTGGFLNSRYKGHGGMGITPYCGFALETEYYPDFMNHEGFAGCYLEPGLTWTSTTSYRLERI